MSKDILKKAVVCCLILVMALSLASGCKPQGQEELGVADDWIGVTDEEAGSKPSKDASKDEKEPSEQKEQESSNPKEEQTPPAEENKKPQEDVKNPQEGNPSSKEEGIASDEEQKEEQIPDSSEQEAPITKEESGIPITFLVQNLRTAGAQTADTQGQREDTLGRTGQANELYSRARRFRENAKRIDPDVILGCEGTIGWIQWFQSDAYFKQNFGLVYHWADGGKSPVGNDGSEPILYKKAKYTLMDSGVFWYSDSPKHPSFFVADEGFKNCTWAKLKDKASGTIFYAYAIHIRNNANTGGTSGMKSLDLLVKTAEDLPKGSYAFFGGDYNIRYRDDVYQACMDFDKMLDLKDQALNMQKDGLAEIGGNTGSVCPEYEREATGGNYGTPKIIKAPKSQSIDHLMAKTHPRMAVDYWGYDYTTTELPAENVVEGYVSDHYALVVKVRIETDVDYSRYQSPTKD